jgi:leucyl aminopeptidase
MLGSVRANLLLLLGASQLGAASLVHDAQSVLAASPDGPDVHGPHVVDKTVLAALDSHSDPVAALVSLRPDLAAELAQPRLLHVSGEAEPVWATEGDKLRLRRSGRKFVDITDHADFYADQAAASWAGKASESAPCDRVGCSTHARADMPKLAHQRLVKPLFSHVSTHRMHRVLKHMTSYYNRYYGGTIGEESAQWLHDHVAEVRAPGLHAAAAWQMCGC